MIPVGEDVGEAVGDPVGEDVGEAVGDPVGEDVGEAVGDFGLLVLKINHVETEIITTANKHISIIYRTFIYIIL